MEWEVVVEGPKIIPQNKQIKINSETSNNNQTNKNVSLSLNSKENERIKREGSEEGKTKEEKVFKEVKEAKENKDLHNLKDGERVDKIPSMNIIKKSMNKIVETFEIEAKEEKVDIETIGLKLSNLELKKLLLEKESRIITLEKSLEIAENESLNNKNLLVKYDEIFKNQSEMIRKLLNSVKCLQLEKEAMCQQKNINLPLPNINPIDLANIRKL